jgi:hypothetical protein
VCRIVFSSAPPSSIVLGLPGQNTSHHSYELWEGNSLSQISEPRSSIKDYHLLLLSIRNIHYLYHSSSVKETKSNFRPNCQSIYAVAVAVKQVQALEILDAEVAQPALTFVGTAGASPAR